ncbi:Glycoside hydrolase [Trema orientale]|uniref:Glycoside hydrolase n=1 Tax=Trema orientale TaxID=63057 RepID=A0A2P5DV22_TREOI|nr:Glycoside hydrolase [Trema orientale]PON77132.1 Glycoside hydrolase [Trema orientale]
MGLKLNKNALSVLVFLAISVTAQCVTFDVSKLGGKPNSDITQVLAQAWQKACASPTSAKIVVPKSTYKLSRGNFLGPCKSPIEFQLDGILQAPSNPSGFKDGDGWITFQSINKLSLYGGGTFDGQGKASYGKHCTRLNYCSKLPINIRFNFVTNSAVKGITSLDSKQFHILVLGGENLSFKNVKVIAPEDSANTDGIHIGRSTNVTIADSTIQTGDDCISIGDGTKKLTITKVTCGPGHGISVGSLGKYTNEAPVEGVTVRDCTFKNTQNGVRIKTWPDSHEGVASDLHFENLIMDNVGNPVLIDQEYCPWNQCKLQNPSRVKLSKVSFKNIKGTSSTPLAVKLVCSGGYPCQNVEVGGIDIKYNGKEGPIQSICKNVKPKVSGYMNPAACAH